jgi:hypothetical protein
VRRRPTYFGAAGTALGAILLTDTVLGGCAAISGRADHGLDDG